MKYYCLPYFEALNIIQIVGFASTNTIAMSDFIQIKIKEGENIALTLHFVQPPRTICRHRSGISTGTYGACRRHTLSISRINPPPNFGGLKFESDKKMDTRGRYSKVA